ncbi:MAG: serine/threonine protein kinase, partial [Cyanobacteria bacterium J06642_11]
TVGKAGYAPSEQLQSGRAYPSSDLYALAVTVIVLLTGKEPHELFDDTSLSWNWQPYAAVSDSLATVLNKALSYRPGDRYQSVSDISRALQQGGQVGTVAARPAAPPTVPTVPTPQQTPVSQMRTVAVGSPITQPKTGLETTRPTTSTRPRTQVVTSQKKQGGMDSPLALAAMFAGAVTLAGFGGWATVNYVLQPDIPEQTDGIQPLPPPEELEADNNQPAPTEPEPLEPDTPTNYVSELDLAAGEQTTVEGELNRGDTVSYRFAAQAGQTLSTSLEGEGVVLSILDAEGSILRGGRRVNDWQGELPEDATYIVKVLTTRGTEQGTYKISLGLLADEPAPDETDNGEATDELEGTPPENDSETETDNTEPDEGVIPDQTDEPEDIQEQISSQRVQFPAGETGTLRANSVGPGQVQRYIVNAQQEQIMTVRIVQASGPVTFDVRFPGGEPMADAEGVLYWNSYLPLGGDYQIDVRSASTAEFTLDIQVVGGNAESP